MSEKKVRAVNLPQKDLDFIAKAASLFVPKLDVVVYGSRARGDHKWFSDVDIAIFGAPGPFDLDVSRFYAVLDHSKLKVQPKIVQIGPKKNPDFVENVLEDGILLAATTNSAAPAHQQFQKRSHRLSFLWAFLLRLAGQIRKPRFGVSCEDHSSLD